MDKMDVTDFCCALRIIARGMYPEIIGVTAARKSNSLQAVIRKCTKVMSDLQKIDELTNLTYFYARLFDLELSHKVPNEIKKAFINQAREIARKQLKNTNMLNMARFYSDFSSIDASYEISKIITDVISKENYLLPVVLACKLLKSIPKAMNPRLHTEVAYVISKKIMDGTVVMNLEEKLYYNLKLLHHIVLIENTAFYKMPTVFRSIFEQVLKS